MEKETAKRLIAVRQNAISIVRHAEKELIKAGLLSVNDTAFRTREERRRDKAKRGQLDIVCPHDL